MKKSLKSSWNWNIGEKVRLLFVDPGSRISGFCVVEIIVNKGSIDREILRYGKIKLDTNASLQDRVADNAMILGGIFNGMNIDAIIIEHPPDTIYESKRSSKNVIIARAQSLFKVIAICHGLSEHIRTLNQNNKIVFLYPSQWQVNKNKRHGVNIKKWSLCYANFLLEKYYKKKFKELKTKEDENIADAITMSFYAVNNMIAGEI